MLLGKRHISNWHTGFSEEKTDSRFGGFFTALSVLCLDHMLFCHVPTSSFQTTDQPMLYVQNLQGNTPASLPLCVSTTAAEPRDRHPGGWSPPPVGAIKSTRRLASAHARGRLFFLLVCTARLARTSRTIARAHAQQQQGVIGRAQTCEARTFGGPTVK